MAWDNVTKLDPIPDDNGFVEGSTISTKATTGYNDWNDLPETYKSYDFIFQERETTNRGKLFECVKAPDEHSDMVGKFYDWKNKNEITSKYDGNYWCQWVYLSGRVDDYYPVGYGIGSDDINRNKLDDFKYKPGSLM